MASFPKKIYRYFRYYVYETVIRGKLIYSKFNKSGKYGGLECYKDIHEGKRCFIIATGPSLLIDDVERLRNEITFSMNSIIMLFDKIDWRPTYYGIQDREVFKKIKPKLESVINQFEASFIGDTVEDYSLKANYYHLNLQRHLIGNNHTIFSNDITDCIYDGYTITYSMIQVACYMGFKEIYLIGCDTNYNGPKTHFIEYTKEKVKGADNFYFNAIEGYQAAEEYAKRHGIKIVNCTRGGMLEVFERKALEDVL